MLGLILDTFVLMVLIRVITRDENEGWGMPAVIAVLAAVGMIAANIGAAGAPESALLILLGAIAGVGIFVTIGCMILLSIEPLKSIFIGAGFIIYKIGFSVIIGLMFASVG